MAESPLEALAIAVILKAVADSKSKVDERREEARAWLHGAVGQRLAGALGISPAYWRKHISELT